MQDHIFLWDSAMFRLTEEQIAELKQGVQSGDALCCYRLGRYLVSVRPEADSTDMAAELFDRAARGGVADATAALALMWRSGDMGLVDMAKASHMLEDALICGSCLAAKEQLFDMIYGRNGLQSDITKAKKILDSLMEQGENPTWYYIMGCIVEEQTGDKSKAAEWFERAAEGGVTDAYIDLAFALAMDSDGNLTDYDRYIEILDRGIDAGDGQCLGLWVSEQMGLYESWENKEEFREGILSDLQRALDLGDSTAAYQLGNIYFNGDYDVPQDTKAAWQYYFKGAILGSAHCYEAIYDIIVDMDNPFGVGDSLREQIALNGTRCGSQRLMEECVNIYKSGGLTAFASEIEQYYLPLFDSVEC